MVILDDATSEIYYAQLVEEESTRTVMTGVREVIERKGLFCTLYSDRDSHFFYTPKAGEAVDKGRPTQFGRALKELGIQTIAAYSPQARGRSERSFGTWQGRLPQELRLAGITTLEHANRFLRERYIAVQSKVRGASCSPGQGVSQVRTQGLGLDFFGPDVAEQELDLLQLSAGQMAERGATATQIMWGQLVNRSVNGSLLLRADFCASPRVHNLYKLLNGGISCPCYRQES